MLYTSKGNPMTTLFQHSVNPSLTDGVSDMLSPESEKRRIELAFLARIARAFKLGGSLALERAGSSKGADSFSASYARMRSPVFEAMSKSLEQTVPEDAGFGRFRGIE
jgi:hypothetical protein